MEILGTGIYKGFNEWCETSDGKTEGEMILQLGKGTIKVQCYEHQVAGLKKGDFVKVTLSPDNYNYIYLKDIRYDGDQEMLNRLINSNLAYGRN